MRIIDLIGKTKQHPTKRYRTRKLGRINTVVVHHSGTSRGSPISFARYHVNHKDWPGIAYHYVIDTDGECFKTQPLSKTTYHAGWINRKSIGICLIGNFSERLPHARQVDKLLDLISELHAWRPTLAILGHREVRWARTACPGTLFDMDKLRKEIAT